MRFPSHWILVGFTVLMSESARAGVVEFTDKDRWIGAVRSLTTIDFTGFPNDTVITDQYQDRGVLFTDNDDTIQISELFLNDGAGSDSFGAIQLAFLAPQAYLGVDFPFVVRIELYSQGQLIYSSDDFGTPSLGDS